MKTTIISLIGAGAIFSQAAVMSVVGTFEYTFDTSDHDYQGIPLLSGDYAFTFDDSSLIGSGFETFNEGGGFGSGDLMVLSPIIQAFNLDQQIGLTTFTASSVGIGGLTFFYGELVGCSLGGIIDPNGLQLASSLASFDDDFIFDSSYANYSVGSVSNISPFPTNSENNFTVNPVPEPSSAALIALGSLGLLLNRKRR